MHYIVTIRAAIYGLMYNVLIMVSTYISVNAWIVADTRIMANACVVVMLYASYCVKDPA